MGGSGDARRVIGLVGCVATKRDGPAPAKELYVSPLFTGRRNWVERSCKEWFVLSALHGLVHPDTVVAPYDQALANASLQERQDWAARVLAQVDEILGDVRGAVFEIHAGADYRSFGLVDGLRARGASVEIPIEGLSLGRQLGLYSRASRTSKSEWADSPATLQTQVSGGQDAGAARHGWDSVYRPLTGWLAAASGGTVHASFDELETVLGRELPPSARRHRAWWANSLIHCQARSWLLADWEVAAVDLGRRQVSFRRFTGLDRPLHT